MIYRFNPDGSIEPCDLHDLTTLSGNLGVIIAKTKFANEVEVSTVFLSLDHQFGKGPPLVFESMIFGKTNNPEYPDEYQDRYPTVEAALAGHDQIVSNVGKQWVISKSYRWKPGRAEPVHPIPTVWERLLGDEFDES